MPWTVTIARKAAKNVQELPKNIKATLTLLLAEIRESGPVRGDWPNYGKLDQNRHHCHLKKGHPCWVAIWDVTDKTAKLVEVKYVGTHEKAPY